MGIESTRLSRFTALYQRHLAAVANYAGRRADAHDAIDVTAETFLIAWRRIEDAPTGAKELPWLYGIARRVLANQRRGGVRRLALHQRLHGEWHTRGTDGHDPAELGHVRAGLQRLNEADREILLLAGAEELKPSEIAEVLGIAPDVARNRLSRARQRLREALDDAPSEQPAKSQRKETS